MRRSCSAYMAIARVLEKAHTGCHSCCHQAGWTEAHGSLHSGRAAAVIEGLATAVVALREEERGMAMHSQVMAVGRDAGTAAEGIAVRVAAVVVAVEGGVAAGIVQARESAWVPAATWRKTCRRGIGSRWSSGVLGGGDDSTRRTTSFTCGGDQVGACRMPCGVFRESQVLSGYWRRGPGSNSWYSGGRRWNFGRWCGGVVVKLW
jgi:hypothetical protein